MERKIRVLVATYLPWSNDISVGNTLSNIFKGMEDRMEFANIYFREDVPDNDIVALLSRLEIVGAEKARI